MKDRVMYGVERFNVLQDYRTTEIFPRLKTALEYSRKLKEDDGVHIPLFIFAAIYNGDRIYRDTQSGLQVWNYDDYSDTILKYLPFEIVFNEGMTCGGISNNWSDKIENCNSNEEIKKLFNYPNDEMLLKYSQVW